MDIIKAQKSDMEILIRFYDRMCRFLDGKSFLPEGNKGGFPSEDMLEKAIEEGNMFIGVESGSIVAAYIMNHECDEAYKNIKWNVDAPEDKVVILHALRVLPEYGGRGYSKALVKHAIKTAREMEQKAIRLDCIEGNDVPVKVYMSCGFEYVDTVEITYADIGIPKKFKLYELVL